MEPSGSLTRMAAVLGVPTAGSACSPAFLVAFRCCRAEARSLFFFSAASSMALHTCSPSDQCAVLQAGREVYQQWLQGAEAGGRALLAQKQFQLPLCLLLSQTCIACSSHVVVWGSSCQALASCACTTAAVRLSPLHSSYSLLLLW